MSRFYSSGVFDKTPFDIVTESAIVSMSSVVDEPEFMITTENFGQKIKDAFNKICETIMKWVRKVIQALKDLKNWVVKNARLIVAKIKGDKKEVKVTSSKNLDDAVKLLESQAQKVHQELKEEESGKAVDAEVMDDSDDFDNVIDEINNKVLSPEASKDLIVLDASNATKRIAMNIGESTRRLHTVEELVAGFKDTHDIERTPDRWEKTPKPQKHPRRRAIAKAQKLVRAAAAIAKEDTKSIKTMLSITGQADTVPSTPGEEKSA